MLDCLSFIGVPDSFLNCRFLEALLLTRSSGPSRGWESPLSGSLGVSAPKTTSALSPAPHADLGGSDRVAPLIARLLQIRPSFSTPAVKCLALRMKLQLGWLGGWFLCHSQFSMQGCSGPTRQIRKGHSFLNTLYFHLFF